MTEKLKPIGDCIFDERGLLLDKSGNINCNIAGLLRDITNNCSKILNNSNDEVTIEIIFEKTALLIQQNQDENIAAASFTEIKK
jgi:hypothetical protein